MFQGGPIAESSSHRLFGVSMFIFVDKFNFSSHTSHDVLFDTPKQRHENSQKKQMNN